MGDIGVSNLYGQYDDYQSFGIDFGFRQYTQVREGFRGYGEATIGVAVINETDIKSQTRRVLLNLQGILKGAGVSLSNVVRTTVFLKNMGYFADFNGVYAEFFNVDPPARATVEVARLPRDVAIEIDCIAVKD